jgi:hypothetical protein
MGPVLTGSCLPGGTGEAQAARTQFAAPRPQPG